MNLQSVFLRDDCVLPDSVKLSRHTIGRRWSQAEGILSPALDGMIRHAGWHYIWITGKNSCTGYARTRDNAIDSALINALSAVPSKSNAAEVDSIKVTRIVGFSLAHVTLHHRRIQQSTLLETEEKHLRKFQPFIPR